MTTTKSRSKYWVAHDTLTRVSTLLRHSSLSLSLCSHRGHQVDCRRGKEQRQLLQCSGLFTHGAKEEHCTTLTAPTTQCSESRYKCNDSHLANAHKYHQSTPEQRGNQSLIFRSVPVKCEPPSAWLMGPLWGSPRLRHPRHRASSRHSSETLLVRMRRWSVTGNA